MRTLFVVLGVLLIHQSCVPARKADELRSENDSLRKVLTRSQDSINRLVKTNDSLVELNKDQKRIIANLRRDTSLLGKSIRKLKGLNQEMNQTYERLVSNKEEIISDKASKSQDLSEELNQMKLDLKAKEKRLNKKAKTLYRKTVVLDSVKNRLNQREKRIHKIRGYLGKKDSTLDTIQTELSDSLNEYDESDVTVEKKDWIVNVKLTENLLYDSGQHEVKDSAKAVLGKISAVFKAKPSFDILIKSYTSDSSIKNTSQRVDQKDLSRLRANEVVTYLSHEGSIKPERLSLAGYSLGESNDEAHGRLEFILSMEMNRLTDILQTDSEK